MSNQTKTKKKKSGENLSIDRIVKRDNKTEKVGVWVKNKSVVKLLTKTTVKIWLEFFGKEYIFSKTDYQRCPPSTDTYSPTKKLAKIKLILCFATLLSGSKDN